MHNVDGVQRSKTTKKAKKFCDCRTLVVESKVEESGPSWILPLPVYSRVEVVKVDREALAATNFYQRLEVEILHINV